MVNHLAATISGPIEGAAQRQLRVVPGAGVIDYQVRQAQALGGLGQNEGLHEVTPGHGLIANVFALDKLHRVD